MPRKNFKTIYVWRFDDAPKKYRELSPHGGDEDWLAYVPGSLKDEWIPWLEPNSSFGVCDVSKHPFDGGHVHIGAHS